MITLRYVTFLLFMFAATETVASTGPPILSGPGTFSSSDILAFIKANPAAVIRNLTIEGKLDIPYEQKISNLQFSGITFEHGLIISGDKGDLSIYGSVFKGVADLYLANFKTFHCEECKFYEDANFHSIEAESLWLNKSVFNGHVVFVNSKVDGLLNLADVSFSKTVDFSGATIGELNPIRVRSNLPINILWGQFGKKWLEQFYFWALAPKGEERLSRLRQIEMSLRYWLKNFQQLGLRNDKLIANYELMLLRRQYFFKKMSMEWFASILLEMPSRYGTRPFRPMTIGFLLIVIFGIVYWIKDPFKQNQDNALGKNPIYLFSFLYSLDTFIPLVNITGVKEWGWVIKGEFRWFEVIERILGLTISTLAVYSISSHFF